MLLHYKAGNEDSNAPPGGADWEAHNAIIAGLVETLEMLRKRNNGRFPTNDRITQEVILSAAMKQAKGTMISAIGALRVRAALTSAVALTSAEPVCLPPKLCAFAVQAECWVKTGGGSTRQTSVSKEL